MPLGRAYQLESIMLVYHAVRLYAAHHLILPCLSSWDIQPYGIVMNTRPPPRLPFRRTGRAHCRPVNGTNHCVIMHVTSHPPRPPDASHIGRRHTGATAAVRVSVQVGPARLPVLEVRLPGSTVLGDLRCEVARRFRVPAESLELVRVVSCVASFVASFFLVCVFLERWQGRGY